MKRTVAIAACGFSLAGCSGLSMPSMPSFSLGSPAPTTIQFESEPAGAEARTSTGQACRTPCSLAVAASEFTVAFTLQGFQPQTVPVRIAASTEPIDPNTGMAPAPRMVPNPVYVELVAAPPQPAARKRPPARPRPQQPAATAPRPAAPAPAPPAAPAAPAPAPAAAWPPPPQSSPAPATAWPPPPQQR